MDKLIGRHKEQAKIQACMESGCSGFIVIYGRRRIGKTFLVRRFFKDTYDFSFVGKHDMPKEEQLNEFAKALQTYSQSTFLPALKSWNEAFECLQQILSSTQKKGKKVVFL